jgi:hypothetical protein
MAIHKRISLLALTILTTSLAVALIVSAIFGGGARRTVASRSAEAFREALRKGEPVTPGSHGHGALSPAAAGQPAHAEHGGADMKKHEHAEQGSSGMTGHGVAPSGPSGDSHAAHRMSAQAGRSGRAGRAGHAQEATEDHAGMQHGRSAAPNTSPEATAGAALVPPPSLKALEASPGQPALTLQPDPLDQPPDTSIEEAKRAAEMAQEMTGGHGMQRMQHGMTSYRQLDAGRDSVTTGQGEESVAPGSPTSPDHRGMQHGSPTAAQPKAPATRKPPPSKPTPGAPPPEPTHPPHHSGGSGAAR